MSIVQNSNLAHAESQCNRVRFHRQFPKQSLLTISPESSVSISKDKNRFVQSRRLLRSFSGLENKTLNRWTPRFFEKIRIGHTSRRITFEFSINPFSSADCEIEYAIRHNTMFRTLKIDESSIRGDSVEL